MEADNAGLVRITFPPRLDSEMGPSRAKAHLYLSSFATLWHGFTVVFPLQYSKGHRIGAPRAIANY